MVHPYAAPLESIPNLLTHPPSRPCMGWVGGWVSEPKIGASACNIKAYLKPLPAETVSRTQPLYQPCCQRGVCRGLLLFHRHLSLEHSTIPALFICLWSLNGKGWHGNESAPVETRLKCWRHILLFALLSWLRSPKVAFSVYFHICCMQLNWLVSDIYAP